MIVFDVSALLALYRRDHPHHAAVSTWWRGASAAGVTVTAPDAVWSGLVRVATNPRVFSEPSPASSVFEFLRGLHAQPNYLPATHVSGVLDEFERVCEESRATGLLVPDAYIAAFARCLGAGVVTFDRDFRRFDGLDLVELG